MILSRFFPLKRFLKYSYKVLQRPSWIFVYQWLINHKPNVCFIYHSSCFTFRHFLKQTTCYALQPSILNLLLTNICTGPASTPFPLVRIPTTSNGRRVKTGHLFKHHGTCNNSGLSLMIPLLFGLSFLPVSAIDDVMKGLSVWA